VGIQWCAIDAEYADASELGVADQSIQVCISHREEIIAADGSAMTVVLHATFGGGEHAVSGSPLMDTVACKRISPRDIASTGKKAGAVTLTDTLTVSPDDDELILSYSLFDGIQEVARGTGIFERRA
jgi:hypothetical protein